MAYNFGSNSIWLAEDLLEILGLPADLTIQTTDLTKTTQNATVTDENGNTLTCSNSAFDIKDEQAITFKASCDLYELTDIKIGGRGYDATMTFDGGVVVTSIAVARVNNDYPTITLTAHAHANNDITDHLEAVDQTNEWTLSSIDMSFGIPTAEIFDSEIQLQSQNITWSVQHVDRLNNVGTHLIGNSFGFRKDITETAVYESSATYDFTTNGYIEDSINDRTINVNFREMTLNGHKFSQ